MGKGSCSPESWRTLLYTLQLLTGDVPLAFLLGRSATFQLWVMVDEKPAPAAPIPKVLEMSAPLTGTKCQWHSSDQDVSAVGQDEDETLEPDYPHEEHAHQKWKEVRPAAKPLKEPHWEAFSKESGRPITRPTILTLNKRDHMTSPPLSGRWLPHGLPKKISSPFVIQTVAYLQQYRSLLITFNYI